jgi:cob(I)alamin adenosyltransferase
MIMSDNSKSDKSGGLLIVYTGHGKGKTTAALGMCVRAVGYDWKVSVVQFVKGSWKYGELEGIKRLAPNVQLRTVGEGFVGIVDDDKDIETHRQAAREGLELVEKLLNSGEYDLLILDELNVALKLDLISAEAVQTLLSKRRASQHVVITGRDAPDWLIEQADLVTEMLEIKHPFQVGLKARKGIDW